MRSLTRLALTALLVVSFGCNLPEGPTPGSSSSSGTGTNISQGAMSAVIGNIPWNANARVTATYSPSQNGIGTSILNITGSDFPLTAMLSLTVPALSTGTDLLPGTFQIGTSGLSATLTDSLGNTFQAAGSVGSGTVTIVTFSRVTRTATGTFTFVVVQTGAITTRAIGGGSFSVTF